MKVSVFMFCRNGAAIIRRAIESVLAQDWEDLEFIVQDGASTDGTIEILEEYGDRIDWESEPDSGPDEGFYRAIERCSGEFIGSCLVDEEMLPGSVSTAVRVLTENPGLSAITRDAVLTDLSGREIGEFIGREFQFEEYLEARYVPHFSTSFFRRSSILNSGILKKPWRLGCGEFEFWVRMMMEGDVRYWKGFASKYAIHDEQLSRRADNVVKLAEGRVGVLQEIFGEHRANGLDIGTSLNRCIAGNVRQFGKDLLTIGDRKRFDQLIERVKQWLEGANPGGIETKRTLGALIVHCRALDSSQEYELLESVASLYARAYPDEAEFTLFRFRAMFKCGRPEQANRFLEGRIKAGRLNSSELASSFHELAQYLESKGQVDRAIDFWERAWPGVSANSQSQALVARIKSPLSDHLSLLQAHCRWGRRFVVRKPYAPLFAKEHLAANGRIRIGVSCSFWSAPTIKYQFLSFVDRFDKDRFEFIAYVNYDDGFRGAPGISAVRITHGLTEEEFAEQAQADDLDILVELNGHSPGHRFAAMGLRCAPIQVSYLNYTATSGVYEVDYLIGDEIACGKEEDSYSCETIFRLPRCFFCFSYEGNEAPSGTAIPSQINGYVTFGCFASAGKINPDQVRVFARLLESIPTARLIIRNAELRSSRNREVLWEAFKSMDAPIERLEILPGLPRDELLKEYGRIDITLDTHPYNGGNCVAESLWHGIPVITCYGTRFSSRYGGSLLAASGCSEFIARSEDDYIRLCVELSENEARRTELRGQLPKMMKSNGFSDTQDFATHLGHAFEEMVARYRRSRDFCARMADAGLGDELAYGNVYRPWVEVGANSDSGFRYLQQVMHWVDSFLLGRSGMRAHRNQLRCFSALGRNVWFSRGVRDACENNELFKREISRFEKIRFQMILVCEDPYYSFANELLDSGGRNISEASLERWAERVLSPVAACLRRSETSGSAVHVIDSRELYESPEKYCRNALEFVLGRPLIDEEGEALDFAIDSSFFDEALAEDGFKVALRNGYLETPSEEVVRIAAMLEIPRKDRLWLEDKMRAYGLDSFIRIDINSDSK